MHLCCVLFERADPVSLEVEVPQSHHALQRRQGCPLVQPVPPHIQQLQPEAHRESYRMEGGEGAGGQRSGSQDGNAKTEKPYVRLQ